MPTSTDVFSAIAKLPATFKNTHIDAATSERQGLLWAKNIRKSVDEIFTVAQDCGDRKAAVRKIDYALRHSTHWMRNRMLPPFISAGSIKALNDPKWLRTLCHGEQPDVFEHVVPIESALNGHLLIDSPKRALLPPAPEDAPLSFNLLSRVLITPTCRIISFEDRRLATYLHPDWKRPFMRYEEANRYFPDHEPIRVYSTQTGHEVSLENYTWHDFHDELSSSRAYSIALDFLKQIPDYIEKYYGASVTAIEETALPEYTTGKRAASKAYYTREGRHELERLAHMLLDNNMPLTVTGRRAIEIPVNRDRLSIDLLHPGNSGKNPVAVRLNIGPERSKFELYHNTRNMSSGGKSLLEALAARLRVNNLSPDLKTDGNMHFYHYGKLNVPVSTKLSIFLEAITSLYSEWSKREAA